jgi:hypothetical protein
VSYTEEEIRAEAESERIRSIDHERDKHRENTMAELRRHAEAMHHIEQTYDLRLSVLRAASVKDGS